VIIVSGHITLAPEHRDTALAAIATCVEATRAEDGNEDYRFSADLGDQDRINIYECWATQEAMDTHMATAHLADLMTAIGPCIGGSVELTKFEVSSSSKLM
jgi:quinol monooxygenase YgiN